MTPNRFAVIAVITIMLTTTISVAIGSSNVLQPQSVSAQNQIGSNLSTTQGANTMAMNDMMGSSSSSTISNADNFTGSISIFQPIINGFKSSIHITLNDAIATAEQSIGNNSTTLAAFIHPEREFIVYNVFAIDVNNIPHKVIVDPGNGNILSSQQMSFMEMMTSLHGGGIGSGKMDHSMMGPQGMGMMDHSMMGPQGMGAYK